MDWKYKHFHQERIYPEPRELVFDGARAFMSEQLGWKVTETSDGLTAHGNSFFHQAIASLRIESAEGGTRVTVELLVERASILGYMLVDVGGYYSIQIRKWLDGIHWELRPKLVGNDGQSTNPLVLAANKPSAYIFNAFLVFIVAMFSLYVVVTFISSVVGLITGNLYLVGRGGTLAVHGLAARTLSAMILMFGAYLAWRIRRRA